MKIIILAMLFLVNNDLRDIDNDYFEIRHKTALTYSSANYFLTTEPVPLSIKKEKAENMGFKNLTTKGIEHLWGKSYRVRITDKKTLNTITSYLDKRKDLLMRGESAFFVLGVQDHSYDLPRENEEMFFEELKHALRSENCDKKVLEDIETYY